jgi:hypothetical protein
LKVEAYPCETLLIIYRNKQCPNPDDDSLDAFVIFLLFAGEFYLKIGHYPFVIHFQKELTQYVIDAAVAHNSAM